MFCEHFAEGAGSPSWPSFLDKKRAAAERTKSCTDAHSAATTLTKIQSTEYFGEMPHTHTHKHTTQEPNRSGEEELV